MLFLISNKSMNSILNTHTRNLLTAFVKKPSHALLLIGPSGIGKDTVTNELIGLLLNDASEAYRMAYVKTIQSVDGKQIGIDDIRSIEKFLQLRAPKSGNVNRIIIIRDSNLMTIQAQNALLKTLESPPLGTLLILTSSSFQALLPTIQSRSQQIYVERPDLDNLRKHFITQGFKNEDIDRALSISGGLPGLSTNIISGTDHPLLPAIDYAKQILSSTSFDRLTIIDELQGKKELTMNVLFILQQMAHYQLSIAKTSSQKRWATILTASYSASELLRQNVLPKLVLTDLMLGL